LDPSPIETYSSTAKRRVSPTFPKSYRVLQAESLRIPSGVSFPAPAFRPVPLGGRPGAPPFMVLLVANGGSYRPLIFPASSSPAANQSIHAQRPRTSRLPPVSSNPRPCLYNGPATTPTLPHPQPTNVASRPHYLSPPTFPFPLPHSGLHTRSQFVDRSARFRGLVTRLNISERRGDVAFARCLSSGVA
jgi:hypothetical protein